MAGGYILGNRDSEITRLEIQATLFDPLTKQTLLNAGLRKGMRCIDIGCGSGAVTRLMANMVGNTGHVVGVDIDNRYLQYCNSNITSWQNIEFVHDDICKSRLDSEERFDIAYSRFTFHHLTDRREAVRSMKRLTKKGGTIMIQDLDHAPGSWLCYPENKAFNTLRKVYVALIKKRGGDPLVGRKLYKLLIDDSLTANVDCYSPCILMGQEPYSSLGWQLAESIKPQILEHGLQSEQEYAKMYQGLRTLAKDRGSFVTYSRLFSAFGRNSE
ncbi:MAG: methyltransferase domain-containing protein [Thermoproteota archaeon]|nr:methyltransferase domain-containing protein [Thermoproteota archaeon]